jgi:iodotyrosine deiodinase
MSESLRDALAARPYPMVPLAFTRRSVEDSLQRARDFHDTMQQRRTTRHFSSDPVPRALIEMAIRTAASAPSGAHQQPWTFVAVSDAETKRRIREAAEKEEQAFYNGRAPQEWIDALAPLGTDEHKPFLEAAPWLIVIFAESYGELPDGRKVKHYYTQESVGIATGILITAVHHAGLVSLTHTPSPMGFLNEILDRPARERAFLILVVGFPAEGATVPDITKKPLAGIATFR